MRYKTAAEVEDRRKRIHPHAEQLWLGCPSPMGRGRARLAAVPSGCHGPQLLPALGRWSSCFQGWKCSLRPLTALCGAGSSKSHLGHDGSSGIGFRTSSLVSPWDEVRWFWGALVLCCGWYLFSYRNWFAFSPLATQFDFLLILPLCTRAVWPSLGYRPCRGSFRIIES